MKNGEEFKYFPGGPLVERIRGVNRAYKESIYPLVKELLTQHTPQSLTDAIHLIGILIQCLTYKEPIPSDLFDNLIEAFNRVGPEILDNELILKIFQKVGNQSYSMRAEIYTYIIDHYIKIQHDDRAYAESESLRNQWALEAYPQVNSTLYTIDYCQIITENAFDKIKQLKSLRTLMEENLINYIELKQTPSIQYLRLFINLNKDRLSTPEFIITELIKLFPSRHLLWKLKLDIALTKLEDTNANSNDLQELEEQLMPDILQYIKFSKYDEDSHDYVLHSYLIHKHSNRINCAALYVESHPLNSQFWLTLVEEIYGVPFQIDINDLSTFHTQVWPQERRIDWTRNYFDPETFCLARYQIEDFIILFLAAIPLADFKTLTNMSAYFSLINGLNNSLCFFEQHDFQIERADFYPRINNPSIKDQTHQLLDRVHSLFLNKYPTHQLNYKFLTQLLISFSNIVTE